MPNVWSEFGATLSGPLFTRGSIHAEADAYVIRGFQNDPNEVLLFTGGGADDVFAVGSPFSATFLKNSNNDIPPPLTSKTQGAQGNDPEVSCS